MKAVENGLIEERFGYLDPVEAVQRVFSSRYGPRVKTALIYVLEGAGYRDAAHRVGLSDHRDVFRAARKLGLDELHLQRKVERDASNYSKRDRAAIEALFRGDATLRQLVRAGQAADKRVSMLGQR